MSIIQAAGSGETGSSGFYSTTIDQSLKFDDGSSAYLTRTPSGSGNRRTFTFSCWVKRGAFGEQALLDAYSDDSNRTRLMFDASNRFQFFTRLSGADHSIICNAVCRDPSAWYHVVYAVDTTQSTASNRVKIYINGESQTFTGTGFPDQDEDTFINHTVGHSIGSGNDSGGREIYFDGYLAEINMIDGTALDASSFGQTKNGIWIPKNYSGSYGTNGFHLPFSFTEGNSVEFDGTGDNISWSNATQYDIATDDDFCLEFFMKADIEANWAYGFGDYTNANWVLQLGPSGIPYLYYPGGSITFSDMSTHITTTDWHHIALVRESGTHRFYVDGVQRSTSTSFGTTAVNMAHFDVGDAHEAGGASHLNGTYSNLRFTIGAARYGSGTTFTVPTSTLTNDSSNVKLLAFTTSTITADASTAAVSGSITEGDPRFSLDNPFSVTLGNDTSGNNNDFSSSGLVFNDVFPDSPTNNFPTFNPVYKYWNNPPTISEGNLKTRTASSEWKTLLGTMGVSSGKWYAEFLVTESSPSATAAIAAIGILDIGANNAIDGSWFIGYEDNSVSYYGSTGQKFISYTSTSTYAAYGGTYGAGDIIGVALDLDAGTVKFYKNNTVQDSGTAAATSLSGTFVFGVSVYATAAIVANFGQDSSFSLHASSTSAYASDANGIGDFFYAPPSGHLAVCSSNLPDITIGPGQTTQADDYFNTVLWTGNETARSITGVGFSPDWCWMKSRSDASGHRLYDTVRGATKGLSSDSTGAEYTESGLTSFDADGFSLGTQVGTNGNSKLMVGWNWLAGGTPTATNSAGAGNAPTSGSVMIDGVASTAVLAGTIPATKISANRTAGFSIITYTGNGSSSQTVAHGLSSAPEFIIHKDRDTNSNNNQWNIYHAGAGDDYAYFTNTGFTGSAQIIPSGTTTIELKANLLTTNENGDDFLMYAFHSVAGYSKFGLYAGNGDTSSPVDGPFTYTGFRPAWIMIKRKDGTGWWGISDNARSTYNEVANTLAANHAYSESTLTSDLKLDFLSNGFKIRDTDAYYNASSGTYVYIAFAEQPFKFSNAR